MNISEPVTRPPVVTSCDQLPGGNKHQSRLEVGELRDVVRLLPFGVALVHLESMRENFELVLYFILYFIFYN